MDAPEQKAALRKNLLWQRRQHSLSQLKLASNTIISSCIQSIDWASLTGLHSYVPVSEGREVDTWPLLHYSWKQHPAVPTFVPVIGKDKLLSTEVNSHTVWKTGVFGVPVPDTDNLMPVVPALKTIVVPVLGFDEEGYRLGYGGGFYDRFLKKYPIALTIGLSFQFGLLQEGFSHESHDIPLDVIITEQSVYTFRRQTS